MYIPKDVLDSSTCHALGSKLPFLNKYVMVRKEGNCTNISKVEDASYTSHDAFPKGLHKREKITYLLSPKLLFILLCILCK